MPGARPSRWWWRLGWPPSGSWFVASDEHTAPPVYRPGRVALPVMSAPDVALPLPGAMGPEDEPIGSAATRGRARACGISTLCGGDTAQGPTGALGATAALGGVTTAASR